LSPCCFKSWPAQIAIDRWHHQCPHDATCVPAQAIESGPEDIRPPRAAKDCSISKFMVGCASVLLWSLGALSPLVRQAGVLACDNGLFGTIPRQGDLFVAE